MRHDDVPELERADEGGGGDGDSGHRVNGRRDLADGEGAGEQERKGATDADQLRQDRRVIDMGNGKGSHSEEVHREPLCVGEPLVSAARTAGWPMGGTGACPTWTTWLTRRSTDGVMRLSKGPGNTPRTTMAAMSGAI